MARLEDKHLRISSFKATKKRLIKEEMNRLYQNAKKLKEISEASQEYKIQLTINSGTFKIILMNRLSGPFRRYIASYKNTRRLIKATPIIGWIPSKSSFMKSLL